MKNGHDTFQDFGAKGERYLDKNGIEDARYSCPTRHPLEAAVRDHEVPGGASQPYLLIRDHVRAHSSLKRRMRVRLARTGRSSCRRPAKLVVVDQTMA